MKKFIQIFFLFLLFAITTLQGQNLVPNPSFEEYDTCPDNMEQIYYVLNWSSYRGTAEYYNSCSSGMSVPQNPYGFQYASDSNCKGYCGIYTYNPWSLNDREFIGAQLITPLIIGQKYFLNMKVNLCNWSKCAANKIGFSFSTIQYNFDNPAPVINFSYCYSINIISDTANWATITGNFIADSSYKYLLIGNFFDDNQTDTLGINGGNCLSYFPYYYIDDICVSTDSLFCKNYTYACSTNISEYFNQNKLIIFPNPSNDKVFIKLPPNIDKADIYILNILGCIEIRKIITKEDNEISLKNVPKGSYIISISNSKFKLNKVLIIN